MPNLFGKPKKKTTKKKSPKLRNVEQSDMEMLMGLARRGKKKSPKKK